MFESNEMQIQILKYEKKYGLINMAIRNLKRYIEKIKQEIRYVEGSVTD